MLIEYVQLAVAALLRVYLILAGITSAITLLQYSVMLVTQLTLSGLLLTRPVALLCTKTILHFECFQHGDRHVVCRRLQEAADRSQASASDRAAEFITASTPDPPSTTGPASTSTAAPLTVGRAMLASKEAAAEAAAKGLPTPSGPDPADGPSRLTPLSKADLEMHLPMLTVLWQTFLQLLVLLTLQPSEPS